MRMEAAWRLLLEIRMGKKLSITKISETLERASRVATAGDKEERSGRFLDNLIPLVDDDARTTDEMVVYQTDRGIRLNLVRQSSTLWMTQRQIADLFGVNRPAITKHLRNIFAEGELERERVSSKLELTAADGKLYHTQVYNLDAIISVGYRVASKQATMFRIWATERLVEFAIKGFTLDDERLKAPDDQDYFAELRERIRDIRASETNVYREIREICTLCYDYDPRSRASRIFFSFTQNKLLWGVTSRTAPELIKSRANSKKENMGLTVWPKKNIRKVDVTVAKNYLQEEEIRDLNRLTNMLLDFFEDHTERHEKIATQDLEDQLDRFLEFNKRPLLKNAGSVSRAAADTYVHTQYDIFSEMRRKKRQALNESSSLPSPKKGQRRIVRKNKP